MIRGRKINLERVFRVDPETKRIQTALRNRKTGEISADTESQDAVPAPTNASPDSSPEIPRDAER
jgi:hypothetical protein